MNENTFMKQRDKELLEFKMQTGDLSGVKMTGQSIDRIYNRDGYLIKELVGHNLVVNSFLNLVMCLLKQQSGYGGIQYWAVGKGADAWDTNMPTPAIGATRLTEEIGRVPILAEDISFLDTSYEKIEIPSNILQISHTFDYGDCNGTWREFGLFGGNATSELNSGIMINKRHHSIITKTDEMTVERVMRFTLTLT